MTIGAAIDGHRLIVCAGTGGVGKTTVAAAIGLGAALRGRRAMVLTIDPARQLALALGLDGLRPGGEPVPADALRRAELRPTGSLDAGMLDQEGAWDAFIERHAPTPAVRDQILGNAFYQELSGSFSGSTEYMAIEEMCRLDESGRYDLIVLDTPPADHALDFLSAPERIDQLFTPDVESWLSRPYQAVGRGAWRAVGATARFVVRRLEHAAGRTTLRDISAFFVAFDALLGDVARRTRMARSLLRSADTAFVLVTGPQQRALADTEALVRRMGALRTPLRAVVLNRIAPDLAGSVGPSDATAVLRVLAESAPPDAVTWMRRAWFDAVAEAAFHAAERERLEAALPADLPRACVAEASQDVHSLSELAAVAAQLW